MRRPRRQMTVALVAGVSVLALVSTIAPMAATAQDRERLDVQVFARIGSPGQPEGIVVDEDGTVYVGTHNAGKGDADAPSVVFAHDEAGRLLRTYEIEGQHLDEDHGILAMAFDADGVLYILDRAPARVLTLDPRTGAQATYATFEDVPSCGQGGPEGACSGGVVDLAPFPDYPVFAPDGTMYVTDLEQALIWRVPRGGGEAEVWFTDARLESVFGPNGIQFLDDGRTLLFAQTGSLPPGTTDAGTGKLYTLPVLEDGSPGELELFWEGQPVDGPDGFAIAESGNVYVALAGANQVLQLGPDGSEVARVPATPIENQMQEVPFDTPASVAFLGQRILVTNQSFFTGTSDHWAVFDILVGEPGRDLFRPKIATAGPAPDAGATTSDTDDRSSLPATGGGAATVGVLAMLIGAGHRRRARPAGT